MFRFLCSRRRLYRANGFFFFNGVSTTTTTLCFLKIPFRSISGSTDNITPTHPNSFTVSYLINSCGLSHENAISVSKKVHFESSTKPDSVLTLFKHYEFPNTHISKIVQKRPLLLLANADNTLKPKLEYFNSLGLSGLELANFLASDPHLLCQSLEKRIIPSIAFLKSMVHTQRKVITVIKRSTRVLRQDLQKWLAPNIAILQTLGVSDYNITNLLILNAKPLWNSRFNDIIEQIKKMKFDPSKLAFVKAIHVLSSLSHLSWEARFNIYKRWGWSDSEILMAFRRQPEYMMVSEKNVMAKMEFLVNKMSYDPLIMTKYPKILMHSLENRIIPRLSVLQVLISKDLVKKECNIYTMLALTDEKFLKRFIIKFEEKVPQLLTVYQEKRECPVSTH